MPDNIDSLNIQISANANAADKAINNLITTIGKLGNSLSGLNSSGLNDLSNGVMHLSTAMKSFKDGAIKTQDFTRIASGLNKLGSVDVQGVSNAARAINTLTSNLQNIGSINVNSAGLIEFTNAIAKLGRNTVTQAVKNIPKISQNLSAMIRNLNGITNVTFDVSGLSELTSSITKLGGKSATNAAGNIDKITDALNRMMNILSRAPSVSRSVISMTNAMANLAQNSARLGSASRNITSGFNTFGTSAGKANKKASSLAATIGKLYATFWVLQRGISALGKSVKSSMDFIEAYNYFDVALSKVGREAASEWKQAGYESAEAYADSFKNRMLELTQDMTGYTVDESGYATYTNVPNLGMNPQDVLNYSAMFAQMANSIGLTGEMALKTSKAFVMLGADWASLRNISLDEAWRKFASALAGETEAIRQLGLDVTQTTLQYTAYKYGIEQSISTMDRATKTQLLLLSVLDQSKVAFGDMAKTIESPANQLRIFQQNIANLARTIGNLFLPIVAKVLPYINGFIIALQRLFALLGLKIGIKDALSDIDSATGGMGDFAGSAEDASDALDDASKNAKKLKSATLGIDELNVVQEPESDGDSGKGGVGGAGGLLDDAITAALEEYESIWDKLLKESKAQQIADQIYDFFKKIAEIAKPTTDALKKLWDEGLSKLADFTWDTLGDFYREFLVPVGSWLLGDNAGLPRLINILNDMLNKIDWGKLRTSLFNFYQALSDLAIVSFDALFDFFDYFLAPLGTWVMSSAIPQLVDIMTQFIENVNWESINKALEDFWKALEPFAENIGQGLINFFDDLSKVGAAFINVVVPGGLEAIAFALNMLTPSQIQAVGYALGALLTGILGFKVVKSIAKIISNFWIAVYGPQIISGVKKVTIALTGFVETLPIITKAAKGNKNALNALAVLYPKLNKVVAKVTDSFEYLWANVNSGSFFRNINTDIINLRGNMSNLQKGVVTAAAGFVEFTVVKDTMYELTAGTEGLVSGIAKIGVVAAGAAAAMYVAFGPAGLVIAAIVGVVGAISGIKKAMDEIAEENAGQVIANALTNPGGIPLSTISEQYSTMFSNIAAQFDSINQKSQELQTTQTNINNTKQSIDTFAFAMQHGATVTTEEVGKIKQQFEQLVIDSRNLFQQQKEIIYMGLSGAFGEAAEELGIQIDQVIANTEKLQTETQARYAEIEKSLSEYEEQLKQGKITQDEYNQSVAELIASSSGIDTFTSTAKKSIDDFSSSLNNINFDEFINADNTLNEAKLNETLSGVASSADEAKGAIEESGKAFTDAVQSMIDEANKAGDTEMASFFERLLSAANTEISEQTSEIDKLAGEYVQAIQDSFINEVPQITEEAREVWNGENGFFKAFHPESTAVADAVSSFNTDFITPLDEAIRENFSQFGETAKPYASEAMGQIMSGLWEYDTSNMDIYGNMPKKITGDISSVVKSGIDGAKKNVGTLSEPIGKDIDSGIGKGIDDNIGIVEDSAYKIGEKAENSARESLDSHSPSRVFISIGKDIVNGLNLGISENATSTVGTINQWMDSVKASFITDQWTSLFSGILPAFQTAWLSVTEWWTTTAIPEFWSATSQGVFSLENWMLMFENMKLGMQTKWQEITLWWSEEAMPEWWENGVMEWFSEEKWTEVLENVFKSFEKEWKKIDKFLDKTMKEILEKLFEKFEEMKIKWQETFDKMKEISHNAFDEIKEDAFGSIDEIISKIGELSDKMKNVGKVSYNSGTSSNSGARSLRINTFGDGGFPQMGELFIAREAGPELVGSIGGRTAVANNDQIVNGIAAGVSEAMAAQNALLAEQNQLLLEILNKDPSIQLDGRELIAGIDQRRSRNGYSFG